MEFATMKAHIGSQVTGPRNLKSNTTLLFLVHPSFGKLKQKVIKSGKNTRMIPGKKSRAILYQLRRWMTKEMHLIS